MFLLWWTDASTLPPGEGHDVEPTPTLWTLKFHRWGVAPNRLSASHVTYRNRVERSSNGEV